jgi:hypothetical protein
MMRIARPVLLSALLAAFATSALASYASKILKPWVGATKQELVAKWGYPQSANDLIRVDDETTVYTYRSFRAGFSGPEPCVVSFTLVKDVVTLWKYEGANCPRYKR